MILEEGLELLRLDTEKEDEVVRVGPAARVAPVESQHRLSDQAGDADLPLLARSREVMLPTPLELVEHVGQADEGGRPLLGRKVVDVVLAGALSAVASSA